METKPLISSNSKLNQVCYSNEENAWHLSFEENLSIRLECFWRLFSENGIVWISNDHNQMFGREKPIDLQYELNHLLKNHRINNIERDIKSGDIKINFDNGLFIEAYTSSSGYESWEIWCKDKTYTGMGQGEISIMV